MVAADLDPEDQAAEVAALVAVARVGAEAKTPAEVFGMRVKPLVAVGAMGVAAEPEAPVGVEVSAVVQAVVARAAVVDLEPERVVVALGAEVLVSAVEMDRAPDLVEQEEAGKGSVVAEAVAQAGAGASVVEGEPEVRAEEVREEEEEEDLAEVEEQVVLEAEALAEPAERV